MTFAAICKFASFQWLSFARRCRQWGLDAEDSEDHATRKRWPFLNGS
jgi:hypothetical protein